MSQYAISTLLTSVVTLLLGLFVIYKQSKLSSNRIFFFFSSSVALWSGSLFFNIIAKDQFSALIFAKLLHLFSMSITISFLHLALILSNQLKGKEKFLAICYGVVAITALLDISPWLVNARYLENFNFFVSRPGSLYLIHLMVFFGLHFYAFLVLLSAFINSKGPERNKFAYFLIATLIGYSGGTANYLINFNIKLFLFWPFGNYTIVAFVAILAFAITKHELMDIRVVISRTGAYSIVAAVLVASFVILNYLKLPPNYMILLNATLGLFWAFAAHRLRELIQTPLDEKWITNWYDSDKLLNSITKALAPVFERENTLKIIAGQLKDKIKIKNCQILLAIKEHLPHPLKYVLLANNGEEIPFEHPFIQFMLSAHDVVAYEKLSSGLKKSLKGIKFLKNRLYLPFFSSEALEGILILTDKTSEDSYNEKDYTLFRTLMNQSVMVFDRTQPYDKIKNDFDASQKKLYDAQVQLERSHRLASLGTLTAGVTHEIRNPLTVLRSESEELADSPRDLEYLQQKRDLLLKHISRIEGIVNRMLGLAKVKHKEITEVDINHVIESVLGFFTISRISLKKELGAIHPIKGNLEEMHEVFVNLINNALQAMPDGGTLTLRTQLENDRVIVQIIDTGKGMPPEVVDKIFDPFFSTRHEGTGLGLSIVYRIVREHGGEIKVQSKEGEGTTFTLTF